MSKKSSRKYPESFILQIIDQYEKRERSIALLAELNGVSVHTVKYWIKEYKSKGMDALMGNKKMGHKITYAPEFKVRVIDYWMEHLELSAYQIADSFHIGRTTLREWKKTYLEKGRDALLKENRGVDRKMSRQKEILDSKKTEKEQVEELKRQVSYLQVENEYLKKLNALTHKKASQQTQKKLK